MQVTKGPDGRYYKPCPECGEMQSYLRFVKNAVTGKQIIATEGGIGESASAGIMLSKSPLKQEVKSGI